MRTLIVTAHPDTGSLTHHAARRLQEELGADRTTPAHLAQEGFDPRFAAGDRRDYLERTLTDPAVAAEQARIDTADHLVLVFPVYWWSLPALLKGWIDRVFVGGWAFGFDDEDRVVPWLDRLTLHLLPLSGTSAASFARHGYDRAFTTQVEEGIVDFCGMRRGARAFVHDSESTDREAVGAAVETAVASVVAAITGAARTTTIAG
ncbi:NAD(P)H-dependent oxidoreductase [Nocardioides sp. ChNu-99]|uniref:NAD(P)H-dependent oxidoreductase n=1 Tax=Nocardioides sp. ChNu-99 TaxID=2839897 RepID=UPI00240568CD|nr:NAD(P)H-dependent oxidoreductase [Nocardioides sp. ChNu-99]